MLAAPAARTAGFRLACLILFAFAGQIAAQAQDFRRRERTFDVRHYRIEVAFDEAGQRVIGNTTIDFKPLRPDFSALELDASRMTIKIIKARTGKTLSYSYDSARLIVHLEKPLSYGEESSVSVSYECTPDRGLYFIQPNASFPDNPRQIWTQGQGEDNRNWFPCYDYPNDKATSEVIMTVDGDYETLSNGVLKSKRKNRDGTTTWHWSQDKPHSSYLIMLAAGRYRIFRQEWGGIPVLSYHYPGDSPEDVRRDFGATADMTAFFSGFFGIRYPWPRYAQIPVAHFLYGGMENTTATVLSDTRAVLDARSAVDSSPEGLIAHELAHQWWGDYVTYIDWDNGWLNEGFATYFQQCWTRHRHGEDEFAYQRWEGIQSYLRWTDEAGRIPVVTKSGGSRQNIYSKGAAVLHMLRIMLGDEQFRRVIKTYGERFAFGSVESNDLKRVIEDVTGMNLQWFFRQWLYEAGYPELRIRKSWDQGSGLLSVVIEQVHKRDSLCGFFRLPMDVLIRSAGGDTTVRAVVDSAETVLRIALDSPPVFISPDHGSAICGRIHFEQSTEELLAHLRFNPDAIKRIEAGLALVPHATDPAVRRALFESAAGDRFYGVRFRIADALAAVKPDSVSYSNELRGLWIALLDDPRPPVRSTALNGLNRYRDISLKPHFERMLSDSSVYVEAAAMNCLLAVDSSRAIREVVLKRLEGKSYQDVLALAAMDWVELYNIKEAEERLWKLAGPGASLQLRSRALMTLLALEADPFRIKEMLLKQLGEPAWQFRATAASLLLRLFPGSAQAVKKQSEMEKNRHAQAAFSRLLKSRGGPE